MKKILVLFLAVIMVLSLTAVLASCGNKTGETDTKQESKTDATTDQPEESASATEEQSESATHQHTPVTDPGKEATCTEPGLTEGSH